MSKQLFGRRLVQLRQQKEISQEELAFRVGVSVMTVRRWEHGKFGPEFDNLEKLAKAFEIEMQDLFDFKRLDDP